MSERVASDLMLMAERAFRQERKALDEVMRLRAALESIIDPPSSLDEPDMDYEVIIKMRAIARAALVSPAKRGSPE